MATSMRQVISGINKPTDTEDSASCEKLGRLATPAIIMIRKWESLHQHPNFCLVKSAGAKKIRNNL